ncbi:Golgi apparatus membrane protein TVP23 homolog B-like [Gigantopelta aegis]|uniref:Golgi apparatus membrane protein TVP23 homolog B-like n=1 Tax=Gigantopelta aegis TaxID=1735272 RepID=UPI001B88A9B7|nr:Golgi apparatus membrane protein TVP23 homolog B-like [Gigantopelta aegis]
MESSVIMEESEVPLNFVDDDGSGRGMRKKLRHPVAVLFHIIFRAGAILSYLLCGLFSDSFITNFVVIVILLSMDFWTVKNITGRLLVGLRWWNYVDTDGKSQWVYECRKDKGTTTNSAAESRIFWLSLVVAEVIWIIFLFGALFTLKFKWFMVVVVGILMNGANLYGYIRCKLGAKNKITSVATNFLSAHLFKSMFSSMTKTDSSSQRATTSQ